ncbi:hypothetical protein Tco_0819572 [Tanacetum coccineum]|uniref:Uncharacterized protein n=1 Tax=Tanacetum coccineum TaxID=301880 RepID=A0ABQ5A7Y0_9ASTR
MNPLSNHSYGFTPYFFAQSPHTPNTSKKDSDFDKNLDDLFRTGAENIKQIGHDIVQESIWEQDDDSEEDQEEDGDDEDTFDMWDIMVEDVERIRKFFNIPDEIDEIVQPACSFMLCDLDFEPLSLSLSSLPSCDLMSLTNMLILLHYLESFKSEFAEVFVFKS